MKSAISNTPSRPTDQFGKPLALLLAKRIASVAEGFNAKKFVRGVSLKCADLTLTQRVELIADHLREQLPTDFKDSLSILSKILGPENPLETGMFTNFYWQLPIAKFVEKYGLDHYEESLGMIEEITKRSTGEYAIRPFIRKYPDKTITRMTSWARSRNFHLRRLASEGLRPKLPWASKLDLFIENPTPVFKILDILKADEINFVKKSVANHLTDYLKVNPVATRDFIGRLKKTDNNNTIWIIRHATRKHPL